MTHYPRGFMPALLALLGVVLASGLGLTPITLAVRAQWDVPWRPDGDARVWLAALHCAGAFVTAAFVGALWSVHMRAGWRRRRQRISGALLCVTLAGLTGTAVALYYVGDDRLAAAAAFAHLVAAGLAVGVFLRHRARGRAARGRAPDRHQPKKVDTVPNSP